MTFAKIPAARLLAACALLGLAGSAGLADGPPARNAGPRVLASAALSPTMTLGGVELTLAPGYSSPSHRHDGSLFAYVLEGEVRSRIDDGPIVLYHPGDSWVEPQGVEHSLFENASATEPARVLAVRVGPPAKPGA
jgi:quercetin dioxygenase-like cupin family protein